MEFFSHPFDRFWQEFEQSPIIGGYLSDFGSTLTSLTAQKRDKEVPACRDFFASAEEV